MGLRNHFIQKELEWNLTLDLTNSPIGPLERLSRYTGTWDLDISKAYTKSRLNLLVDDRLIVELKTVEQLMPVHSAQVISYLKASGLQLGLLINFNVAVLKQGIKRVVLT